MYQENEGPILESRHDGTLSSWKGKVLFIVLTILSAVALLVAYIVEENEAFYEDNYLSENDYYNEMYSEEQPILADVVSNEEEVLPVEVEEKLEEMEGTTADFYYNRALKKEAENDFEGAVADYDQAITLAKRYSKEMFNALNNRGIIKTEQFKDYKGAKKDFNKIIEIETNRYDGNANETRLEAGYTNRAYIKKMLGDKTGACDDLYDALAVSSESSSAYIEKQIEKNCY
jgi:tetratricopeptide (TPR) repeat protein